MRKRVFANDYTTPNSLHTALLCVHKRCTDVRGSKAGPMSLKEWKDRLESWDFWELCGNAAGTGMGFLFYHNLDLFVKRASVSL